MTVLIYLGLLLKAAGFLVRDELLLWLLVAIGLTCDVIFYALQSPPIFPSVASNAILITTNTVILIVIAVERTTMTLFAREKRIF